MSMDIKAVFGFGTLLDYNQMLWKQESFERFDCDFLEWVSQKTRSFEPGAMLDASIEERKKFAQTLPVNYIISLNWDENYLLLTQFHWLLERPKPINVDLKLDEFEKELVLAIEFCELLELNFDPPSWLLYHFFIEPI